MVSSLLPSLLQELESGSPVSPPYGASLSPSGLPESSEMPFQVVELRLDADDKVIDRRAIPYPYPQRLDAVETIEKLITRLQKAHYQAERDYWSAIARDGKTRIKFIIEGV
jgi:hypothetical protein